jgi:hypothetical protein
MKGKKGKDLATLEKLWADLQGAIVALDERYTPEEVMDRIINNPFLTKDLEEDLNGTVKRGQAFQHRYITSRLYAVAWAVGDTLGLPTVPRFAEAAQVAMSWLVTMAQTEALADRRMTEDLFGPEVIVGPAEAEPNP